MTARRVGLPRRPAASGRARARPGSAEDGPDVRAVMRRQLRQALLTVGAMAGLLVGVPVVALWVPAPGVWVALSMGVQCVWVGLAVLHLRRAERLER
ncbi:hypothetical protein [Nonomuraea jiangxiensis]|uniref:Uncharacterized protein n=1 Tax=Nonomuraea jiangxiensis TaxID=633440 RepID=A0A1G8H6M4_9ACTN|nr:hypothetical protein [Nonomuraea jiangxiensis]SDI02298.1 hypothetical protein SAMN05421869_10475 [Nonomuraea jiangxiensis]